MMMNMYSDDMAVMVAIRMMGVVDDDDDDDDDVDNEDERQ